MLGLLEELENQKRMLCDDQMALTWEEADDNYRATITENIATGQEIVEQTRECFDTAAQAVARAVEYQTKDYVRGFVGLMRIEDEYGIAGQRRNRLRDITWGVLATCKFGEGTRLA
ncbi:hypothetical protein LTR15_003037 [Elasticomyces elasticus]|nr:hypothetical protein LTR15_003037 [Elasticomyces elasticus]